MKGIQIIFALCLSGLAVSLYAQDTIYVDKKNKWTKKAQKAESYLVISHNDKLTKVNEYTMDGILKNERTYSSFHEKPDDCIKEGKFISFYPNGKNKIVCEYHNNKRNGNYLKFYENGKEKLVSNYSDGKREGKLMMYYQDGSIWRDEIYQKNELIKGHLYDENGKEINYTPIESMAQYPGGLDAMKEFISKNLAYPPQAAKRKQEGRVLIQIVIDKEGFITNPKVIGRIDDELDKSALTVINKMANTVRWKPAIQDGEPVRMKFTVPITFKIP